MATKPESVCVYVSQSNKSVKTKYIWLEVLQFWYFVMIGFISDLCIRLHRIRYIRLLLVCWLCFFIPALKPPEISSNDLLLIIDYVYVYLPCIWLFRVKNVYEFVLVVNFQRHQFRYLLALSASLRWIASYWSIE